ncbi:MFS transporter [Actinacidiphila sp. ITFR-21]|uniref:MFS transporter n=1 Tax=Actinacidiphila sp. ITFR-21 TaxID=3075199 RepID=UPI00288A62EE|nr:MFS transporter [Streptomyces sp. ITFR-21]WNI18467.1 MFS transporter [Streptomyces sp. ITFR-21]
MRTSRAVAPEHRRDRPSHPRRWAAVVSVAFCSFSLVLSEFLPIGLLSDISDGLRVSPGTAGLLVVVPGLTAAIAAPTTTILAGRADRRVVLCALAALIAASDLLAGVSPNLAVMLLARVLLGIGVGGFWVFGTGVAPRLVDATDATRATAAITSGIALATVASLPLGSLLGNVASWRVAFVLGAGLALAALIAQLLLLPPLPSVSRNSLRSLLGIVRSAASRTVLIGCVATFLAQFAAYTYLEPYLGDHVGFSPTGVTLVLLGFGLAGLVGNCTFTRLIDATPRRAVTAFMTMTAAAIAVLPWVEASAPAVIALVALWGTFWGALPLGLQIFMMRTAGTAAEGGQALFVSTIQVSLAGGSALGGLVVDGAGIGSAFEVAAALAVLGAAVVAVRGSRRPVREHAGRVC